MRSPLNILCSRSLPEVSCGTKRFSFGSVPALMAAACLALAMAVPARAALIGHWTFDDSSNPWQETSGYRPAGTHDGVPIGTDGATVWSAEGRAGARSGGSLDLTAGNCALRIKNTSQNVDADYQSTFDDGLENGMTIAFWAKGFPDTWGPWISKNGEDVGYQVRRYGSENYATFTMRGTSGSTADPWSGGTRVYSNGNNWHHYAAVWDAVNGSRQLYVDGVLAISLDGDFGPFSPAVNKYLVFGARDWYNSSAAEGGGGYGGAFYAWQKCKLDDVRIYNAPLSAGEIQTLAAQEAGTMTLAPQLSQTLPGQRVTFTITLTPQAVSAGAVTVWVTNSNPAAVTIPGAVGGVLTLTFSQGSTNVQSFQAISAAPGTVNLTAGSSDNAVCNVAVINVATPTPPALVAHWTFNDINNPYAETSGYTPTGTHDGLPQDTVATSADIPPGTTGYSLDMTQGGKLRIANTKTGDTDYRTTFDDLLVSRMTIAFWVKINVKLGNWTPFVIKNGEWSGFQVRLNDSADYGCFTVRGTDGTGDAGGSMTIHDGQWHHVAAVRDGAAGLRMLYVDGRPDQASIRATSDTGLMSLASDSPLYLGTGENGWTFNGYLKDVRIYNYALTRAELQKLLPGNSVPMVGHWTFDTAAPWAESSGYQPAGVHDLLPVGNVTFSTDVPPGRTGQSLNLTAAGSLVVVSNSNQEVDGSGAASYSRNWEWRNTFDEGLTMQMSIAFWAKGFPSGDWQPWISKNGEGNGYQVRRHGGDSTATFTVRGTPADDDPLGTINVNDNAWHHYAAVWDGITGIRQLYVDGTLDPGVNLTGDFGPSSNVASWEFLVFGGRDSGGLGNFVPCLLNDVRIYNLALTQSDVQALVPFIPPAPLAKLTTRNAGAQGLRISWPVGTSGYALKKSASLNGTWSDAGLTVTVEGNDNVAYAPLSEAMQFFRLAK